MSYREIEVTDEQYEDLTEHSSDREMVKFMWDNMTEQEQQWTQGEKWIESTVDCGYCGIEKVS